MFRKPADWTGDLRLKRFVCFCSQGETGKDGARGDRGHPGNPVNPFFLSESAGVRLDLNTSFLSFSSSKVELKNIRKHEKHVKEVELSPSRSARST